MDLGQVIIYNIIIILVLLSYPGAQINEWILRYAYFKLIVTFSFFVCTHPHFHVKKVGPLWEVLHTDSHFHVKKVGPLWAIVHTSWNFHVKGWSSYHSVMYPTTSVIYWGYGVLIINLYFTLNHVFTISVLLSILINLMEAGPDYSKKNSISILDL